VEQVSASERYGSALAAELQVWIDQDLCTGDGLCTDHAPAVFTILEDGIAYCREGDTILNDPGGAAGLATVPRHLEGDVIHAAAECPGECIFIEVAERPAVTVGAPADDGRYGESQPSASSPDYD
jgi:ferredoxin